MRTADSIAIGWFTVLSAVSFLAFGYDKWLARRGADRMAERTLVLLGALGGWPGGWIAMKVFRHKTIKGMFQIKYMLALIPFAAEVGAWLRWR